MKHDHIAERVCAVVAGVATRQMPVGVGDTVAQHVSDEQLVEFVEDLEDEFGLILDADTVGEMSTLLEIRDYIGNKLSLIHAH